jgi:hypothetical protein
MNKYFLTTIISVVKHLKLGKLSNKINEEYGRSVVQNDVFDDLNIILNEIGNIIYKLESSDNRDVPKVSSIIGLVKCKMYSIQRDIIYISPETNYDMCCGTQMMIISETSEFKCQNCFRIKCIEGVIFKNDQFYPQDGHKTKHGTYDSMRHYKFWIEHIQGKEKQDFSPIFLDKLSNQLSIVQKNKRLITYIQVRAALKSQNIDTPKYNDHVSLLLKLMGGTQCPILSYDENALASLMFSRIMCIYDCLKLPNKNKPYYPYFIYKILEQILYASPKLLILNYIHLQARSTMIKHDNIYKKICSIAKPDDNLIYKVTNHYENTIQINYLLKNQT